ncbi:MBL fold metallo-hydrolase [Streptomyces avicenniae]|uniref:MBL fold metallo-hydrolase n=1 Tax=Streptomyces avicenniae TaxID=500153 RepID=UPI00069C5DDE|nr:MBL fold metallo-hydrolase [Streptomyces avicenniae]
MSRRAPERVAPGVDRLGDDSVNAYLVHSPEGLVLVDAGLPSHTGQLRAHLAAAGLSPGDVGHVLLTHAHPDHTGMAGALRRAGAEIWVHERDAPVLAEGPRSAFRHGGPERSPLPYLLRRPAALGTLAHLGRSGAFTARPVPGARTFGGDGVLAEVPGGPRVITLAGHTPGSVAYLWEERGLLFTGDALVTYDGLTGHAGPGIVCRGFTHDARAALAALERLAALGDGGRAEGAPLLLPGHGRPFPGGPRAAVEEARARGAR